MVIWCNLNFFFHCFYIGLFCLEKLDTMFFWPQKQRRLGNMFKSKLIAPPHRHPPLPPPLLFFLFCCAALKRERYVLISCSFQEKYIPECSFHVCHIIGEKVFPPRNWQAARPPNPAAPDTCAVCREQPAQSTQTSWIWTCGQPAFSFLFGKTWVQLTVLSCTNHGVIGPSCFECSG